MSMRGFGDLESVVMKHIWLRAVPVSVREILTDIAVDRQIAYTTVMSTMDNLFRKGWLDRERAGRAYLYRAVLTREQHLAQLMLEALGQGGRNEAVLTHFVDNISCDESRLLAAALRRKVDEQRGPDTSDNPAE